MKGFVKPGILNILEKMRKLFFTGGLCLLLPYHILAQEQNDSLRSRTDKYIITNFSASRTLDVQFEQNTNTDYKLKQNGQTFEKGNVSNFSKVKVSSAFSILKTKQWELFGNARYNYYHLNLENIELPLGPNLAIPANRNDEYHYWDVSVNGSYRTKLLNKTVIGISTFSLDGSEKGVERIKGYATVMMVLKHTPTTVINVGLAGMINASVVPVIPIFSYWHKFNSEWLLDITMPKYAYLRHSFTKRDRLSVGMSLENEEFYIRSKEDAMPKVCYFSKSEVKAEVIYESLIGKHFYLTFRGGGIQPFSSRLYDKKRIYKKPYIDISQPMNAFFNVGISYNLF